MLDDLLQFPYSWTKFLGVFMMMILMDLANIMSINSH
jgi:hypothetical protein